MKFSAIFGIVVGLGMIGQWLLFYITRQIPELETEPVRIKFHLAAEFITALTLITAGFGLLLNILWANNLFLVACGMLLYTVMVSPGYFAQKGQWGFVGMFAVILLFTIISLFTILQ